MGSPPFESKSSDETYEKIKKIDFKYPSCVTDGAADLISKVIAISALQ